MKHSFSKKPVGLAVACALALGLLSGTAHAQGAVRSTSGQCIHTSYDDPAKLDALGCNPDSRPVAAYVAPVPQAVAAAPMAAALAPVPAPSAVPVSQKLTFDAETLFDMDKSVLRPSGRTALDKFVYRINTINPEAIMVVGHASRPGTERYNQTLSEERAEAVKTYLVGAGIASSRVRASGKGETQPVTLVGECLNDSSTRAITCRQPDRRVEIELIGARIPQ